jgi:hypothetical protein
MKHWANYHLSTGRLAQIYDLPDGIAPFELPGTEAIALPERLAQPADWRVIDGELTHSPIPERPNYVSNWDENVQAWTVNSDAAWQQVRRLRDAKLLATDWTQLPDIPTETRDAYVAYRQALRDITEQSDPTDITWPAPPQ